MPEDAFMWTDRFETTSTRTKDDPTFVILRDTSVLRLDEADRDGQTEVAAFDTRTPTDDMDPAEFMPGDDFWL